MFQRESLLAALAAACVCTATKPLRATPTSVGELNVDLEAAPSPSLGVLSQGNFDSVHHLIPKATQAVIFEDAAHLMTAVHNGTVSAGLMSGTPPSKDGVATFSSMLISPRAMLTCTGEECDTLLEAIDAAIVRALHNATDVSAARAHAPFEYVSVHTCKTNEPVDRFPFPTPRPNDRLFNATKRGVLKIGALGPYDWGNSGNYTATPPTGFWPDFYESAQAYFEEGTGGVTFERVWFPGSDAVMAAVESGDADVTEPYWTVDAYYEERARQHKFDTSCTTIGYDSTFIVKTNGPAAVGVGAAAGTSAASADTTTVAVAASVGGFFVLAAVGVVLYVRNRARSGEPLWTAVSA